MSCPPPSGCGCPWSSCCVEEEQQPQAEGIPLVGVQQNPDVPQTGHQGHPPEPVVQQPRPGTPPGPVVQALQQPQPGIPPVEQVQQLGPEDPPPPKGGDISLTELQPTAPPIEGAEPPPPPESPQPEPPPYEQAPPPYDPQGAVGGPPPYEAGATGGMQLMELPGGIRVGIPEGMDINQAMAAMAAMHPAAPIPAPMPPATPIPAPMTPAAPPAIHRRIYPSNQICQAVPGLPKNQTVNDDGLRLILRRMEGLQNQLTSLEEAQYQDITRQQAYEREMQGASPEKIALLTAQITIVTSRIERRKREMMQMDATLTMLKDFVALITSPYPVLAPLSPDERPPSPPAPPRPPTPPPPRPLTPPTPATPTPSETEVENISFDPHDPARGFEGHWEED